MFDWPPDRSLSVDRRFRYRQPGMTPALWLGLAIFVGGFALRFWARRPFVDAYARLHQAAPPASWPWTASDDPVVERWRRFTLLGTAMLWIGALLAILNPAI